MRTKDLILDCLGDRWPLKPREIYSILKKKGISYSAMHFALLELLDDKVLERSGTSYFLSPAWVEENFEKISGIHSRYIARGFLGLTEKFHELSFNSINDAFDFIFRELSYEGKGGEVYIHIARLLPIPFKDWHVNNLKMILENRKVVVLCRLNTLSDRLSASYLRSLGVEVYLGVKCAAIANTVVADNKVITFHVNYNIRLLDRFNKSYFGFRSLGKSSLISQILGFATGPNKVTATVVRNSSVYSNYVTQTQKLIPD